MSVAYEFPPVVVIPAQARPAALRRRAEHLSVVPDATIAARPASLQASLSSRPQTLRLTARGKIAIAVGVAVAVLALLGTARLSAPSTTAPSTGPAVVTVHSGDTLWSIATRVAPQRDPRNEVADLIRLNGLRDSLVQPGAVLRTR